MRAGTINCESTWPGLIKQQGILCAHMPSFHRPGHIYKSWGITKPEMYMHMCTEPPVLTCLHTIVSLTFKMASLVITIFPTLDADSGVRNMVHTYIVKYNLNGDISCLFERGQ